MMMMLMGSSSASFAATSSSAAGGGILDKRLLVASLFCALLVVVQAARANPIGVCIRNCAQCKKMFGPYFEGQLCADACVKFKGKILPDCEDIASIAPFLNKFE